MSRLNSIKKDYVYVTWRGDQQIAEKVNGNRDVVVVVVVVS